jgi:hypothetical protein
MSFADVVRCFVTVCLEEDGVDGSGNSQLQESPLSTPLSVATPAPLRDLQYMIVVTLSPLCHSLYHSVAHFENRPPLQPVTHLSVATPLPELH